MTHSLWTQTLGNFDLPPYINGPCHQSFGNLSPVPVPHEWMMMNGKYNENGDYHTANSFGRDALSHDRDNWSGKNIGGKRVDWDGGFHLEQCHAKDCFFGCGGSHSTHTGYIGYDESYGRGWICDDGQYEFGNVKGANVFKGQSFLESNRFGKSSTRYYPIHLC